MPSTHTLSENLDSAAICSVYLDKISERNTFYFKLIKSYIDSEKWLKADETLRLCRNEFNALALEIKTQPNLIKKHKEVIVDMLLHHNKRLHETELMIKDKMRKIATKQISVKATEEHGARKDLNQNFLMKILAHQVTGVMSAILLITSIALLATYTGGIALGVVGLVAGVGFFAGHMLARRNENETQRNIAVFTI